MQNFGMVLVLIALLTVLVTVVKLVLKIIKHGKTNKELAFLLASLIIALIGFVMVGVSGPKNTNSNRPQSSETVKLFGTTKNGHRELQARTQVALKKYNLKDDTYPGLESWKFSKNGTRWNVITSSPSHKRIKAILKWDGKNDHTVETLYLLVDGQEYVNKL